MFILLIWADKHIVQTQMLASKQKMKSAKDNPSTNKLNPGITDSEVEKAIKKSGYPLQTIIANKLRTNFYCQE